MLTMNLSLARKVIGLLSVFALMLVSVSCQGDAVEIDNVQADSSKIEVGREECTRRVAERLAQISMPEGLEKLVAHVKGFYPEMDEIDPETKSEVQYEPIAHPGAACDKVAGIFHKIFDEEDCLMDWDISSDEFAKVNSAIKPLFEAEPACSINEKYSVHQCNKELDAYLANYKLPEELKELGDYVKENFFKSRDERKYVSAKQPQACKEAEEKLKETFNNVHCASYGILMESMEFPEEGQAVKSLFNAVQNCQINSFPWAEEQESFESD